MRHTFDLKRFDVALVGLGLCVLWQTLSILLGSLTLPGPIESIEHLLDLFTQADFYRHLAATARAYVIALILALSLGVFLGVASAMSDLVAEQVEPLMLTLVATPKVTLYPIILLLFGLGDTAKIVFGILHGLPPVIIIMATAFRHIRPILRKTALALRLSSKDYVMHILIPAVSPELVTSFRVCFSLTLLGVLVGEMFASTRGLGNLLMSSIALHDQPNTLAIILLLFTFAGFGSSLILRLKKRWS